LRGVVTKARMQAIQGAIWALARGENLKGRRGIRVIPGNGMCSVEGTPASGSNHYAGGTAAPPLTLVDAKPDYIPDPAALASGYTRVFLTWGQTQGEVADNWSDCLDIPTASSTSRWIYMKANLVATGNDLVVSSCQWVTAAGTGTDGQTAPDTYKNGVGSNVWPSDGTRPAAFYIPLGCVLVNVSEDNETRSVHLLNSGGGSIQLTENVSSVQSAYTGSIYQRQITPFRITY